MENNYLAVIGVDGASWFTLKWLLKEGYMPNLKRLIEKGVSGNLESTIPPVTGAAWLSLATGLNPGKTGVVDFIKHVGDFMFEFVSSRDYYGKSVWDYLSILDYKVAVIDYPMLYPAYQLNGLMICSWGEKLSCYPSGVCSEVESLVGEYDIIVKYHLEKYNDIELFLKDLDYSIKKKLRVSRHYMGREWSLFIDVISHTDWMQHRMWHYIDPKHPLHPGGSEALEYKRRFAEYWQILDEYLGEVSSLYKNIIIVSDHGFGPQWGVFNLSKWLCKHGFMSVKGRFSRRFKEAIIKALVKLGVRKVIPGRVALKAKKQGLSPKSLSFNINLSNSMVVAPQYTIPFGAVHVNPKFSYDRSRILDELISSLEKLSEEVCRELRVKAYFAKEIYSGGKIDLLPDIIISVNNWSCVVTKNLDENYIYRDAAYSERHTGSHRLHGVFIAWGEDFKSGVHLEKALIYDVAPTILYMFNAPIPTELDGNVLRSILRYGELREPRYKSSLYYKARVTRRLLEGG